MMTTPPAPGSRSPRRLRPAGGAAALACALAALAAVCPLRPNILHAAPTPAAPASPAASTALDPTDLGALRAHVNEQVTITGTPTTTGHSKAGNVFYLDFGRAHQALTLVFFARGSQGNVTSEDDLKAFVGKVVTVTGMLTDYKGDLQIKVESLDQLKAAP